MQTETFGDRRNILRGVRTGVFIATAFSLVLTLIRVLVGSSAFDRIGASWLEIVAIYFLCLAVGGGAHGALVPLKRFAVGAAFLGFLFALPMYLGLATILRLGMAKVPPFHVALTIGIILSALVGGSVGLLTWSKDRLQEDAKPTSRPRP